VRATGQVRVTGLLDRLGRLVSGRRTAWLVLAGWVAALAVAGPLAAGLGGVQRNQPVNYLSSAAPSTQVLRLLSGFPGGNRSAAVVVYAHPGGLTGADRTRIAADRAAVPAAVTGAGQLSPMQLSGDGAAALYTVPLPAGDPALNAAVPQLRRLTAAPAAPSGPAGPAAGSLSVAVTGPAGFTADANTAAAGIDGTLLAAAAGVVIVLLLLIYRSPLLWLLPVLSVTGGLLSAQAVITVLARHHLLTVTDLSAGILNVLVFGAATNYALLLISRYREQLHTTADHRAALRTAVRAATPVIAASAGTVIAALLCLLAGSLNSNRGLGPVTALGVAAGLLASLTLLPALLAVCGRRVFWPLVPHTTTTAAPVSADLPPAGMWDRVGVLLARRPRLVWVLTAAILAAGAFGLAGTRLGLPQSGAFRGTVQAVYGQQLLDAHFPAGASEPAQILVNSPSTAAATQAASATPGIAAAQQVDYAGNLTLLAATLTDPPDSPAGRHTITALRTQLGAVPDAHALVGGVTAVGLDTATAAAHDRKVVMPLVLAVVLLALVLLLRAMLAPLLLLATVVLSYACALGVSVATFDLLGLAGTDPSVPLYGFLFLVALGVDYNIFLMTRVREETRIVGTRAGMLRGLAVTGGVITSAGLVLAATFTTLAVLPLVLLTEIGLTVALGVLLDTFLVRSLLVPALVLDLGPPVWWPQAPRPVHR